jgi:hypothetical protein
MPRVALYVSLKAGLITIERRGKRSPRVTLVRPHIEETATEVGL